MHKSFKKIKKIIFITIIISVFLGNFAPAMVSAQAGSITGASTGSYNVGAQEANKTEPPANTKEGSGDGCSRWNLWCKAKNWGNNLLDGFVNGVTKFFNFFLAEAGDIFDMAIYETTNGKNYPNTPGNGIYDAWAVFRDIINIFLIFIVVYIGIRTILQIGGRGDRQLLIYIIIVALLLNFSLVISSVIIDSSNITALAFYDQFQVKNSNVAPDAKSLSLVFLQASEALRSQGKEVFGGIVINDNEDSDPGVAKKIFGALFGGAVMFIATFVLIIGALMFLVRIPALWFYMFLSPLAFAAYILPGTRKHFFNWLYGLLKNAFFVPIFMALFLAVAVIFNSKAFVDIGTVADQSMLAFTMKYAIVIALTIGTLIISKQLGAHGSAAIVKRSSKIAKRSGTRFGSFVGRNTAGRTASALRESETARKVVESKYVPRAVGTAMFKGLDKVAKTRFGNKKEGAKSYEDALKQKKKDTKTMADYVSKDKYGRDRKAVVPERGPDGKILKETVYEVEPLTGQLVEKRKQTVTKIVSAREAYLDRVAKQRGKPALSRIFKKPPTEKNSIEVEVEVGPNKVRKKYIAGGQIPRADRELLIELHKELKKTPQEKIVEGLAEKLKEEGVTTSKDSEQEE